MRLHGGRLRAANAIAVVAVGLWAFPAAAQGRVRTAPAVAHAAAAPAGLACGAVITKSTTLTSDVGPCPGNGLTIAASHVTLNLNGHRVLGTFTDEAPLPPTNLAEGVGIQFANVSGSTVMNGSVSLFSLGIDIQNGGQNQILHMDVHDNIGLLPTDVANNGDGIAMFGSNGNKIIGNSIVHNGVWDGITMLTSNGSTGNDGSSHNLVLDNFISDNNVAMLDGSGAPNWKRDIGIAIEGPGAQYNVIEQNVIQGSGTHGIQMFPACNLSYAGGQGAGCAGTVPNDYNIIRHNTINDNGFGLPVAGAPAGDGVSVLAMGPYVPAAMGPIQMPGNETILDNTVSGNERNGISLGGGNGQNLYDGSLGTNGENYGCINVIGGDAPGTPCGPKSNAVTGNIANGNGEDGIWVGPGAANNVVTRNTANDNAFDGVGLGLAVLYEPVGVNCGNVSCNFATDPSGQPETIPGTAAQANTFTGNSASGNGRWDALDMNTDCATNTWSRDTFTMVNQSCVQ
jgi:parallel beta-helix repeat protein